MAPDQAYILHSDIMVPMRDGIRLATDIYLPVQASGFAEGDARGGSEAAPGPFPAILERTPYGKTIPSRSERSVADPKPLGRAEVASYFTAGGMPSSIRIAEAPMVRKAGSRSTPPGAETAMALSNG